MAGSQSKRKTLRQKYKIKKKVAEHHRQQRKAANHAKALGVRKKKLKKDPGIPNLYPFKKEVLQHVEQRKQQEEADKQRKKEERKARRLQGESSSSAAYDDFEDVRMEAERKRQDYETRQDMMAGDEAADGSDPRFGAQDSSRKAYFKEFRKVVDESDVILEILDARDPMGCRCPDIEKFIMQRSVDKRIVLVLNKIDLVPKQVVAQWLAHLRQFFPTIAFKSNTQQGSASTRLGRANVDFAKASERQIKSQVCLGADTLLKLLKNYTRNKDIKTTISVGVIGYPNVGKSSVINSLSRKKVVDVAALPGCTTKKQDVYLDKHIRLLDCPGIVFSDKQTTETGILLRSNAIKVEQIDDPAAAVELILRQCGREPLMELYTISTFDTSREFLGLVAHKRGKYKRGGVPDYHAAAKQVLLDWNSGKVPFFTVPPAPAAGARQDAEQAVIVTQWAKEFDLDALLQDDSAVVSVSAADADDAVMSSIQVTGSQLSSANQEQMDAIMSGSDSVPVAIGVGAIRKRKSNSTAGSSDSAMAADDLNPQANKSRKRLQKEEQKKKRRQDAGQGSAMQDDEFDGNQAFDFATDFRPTSYVASSSKFGHDNDDDDDDDEDGEYVDDGEDDEDDEDVEMDTDGDIPIE